MGCCAEGGYHASVLMDMGVQPWLLGKVQVADAEPQKDPPKRMPRQLPPRREVIKDDRRNGGGVGHFIVTNVDPEWCGKRARDVGTV